MNRTLLTTLLLATLSLASAQTTIQLILDASGSMFKTLEDGRYRITAAKDVLANMISALPAADDLHVGLRVYGAQTDALSDGACTDSQLVVPMAGFARDTLLGAVREAQARGATPIAHSLELAVQDFQGVDGLKLLVLVTDGEESCGGDVRALAQQLTDLGVELRVIGFDLTERAIESFDGIGAFENARSAEELAQALGRAVQPVAPVGPDTFAVTVRLTRTGSPAEGASVTLVSAISGEELALSMREAGTLTGTTPAGRYRAVLQDALTDAPQVVSNVNVTPDGANVFVFELIEASDATVTVSPAEPIAGSAVSIEYAGAPSESKTWVTLVPPGAPDDAYRAWTYGSGAAGTVELGTPPEPSALEARLLLELPEGGSLVIGRSEPFTTVAAEVRIDAPSEAIGGSGIEVGWTGPDNARDYITIVPQGAAQGVYGSYANTANGNTVTLTAPLEPGAYEIRYVSGQGDAPTLASVPLTVVAAKYAVTAPDRVPARSPVEVTWTGPNNPRDYITIVPQGSPDGTYHDYAYTYEGNPVTVAAPADPGIYEVRYSTDTAPSPTFAFQAIEVMGVDYTLNAPATVAAGASFEVAWTGRDGARDYITIVPVGAVPGAYLDYQYTAQGSPAILTAPNEPGAYEVRYQSDSAAGVFASVPIMVE